MRANANAPDRSYPKPIKKCLAKKKKGKVFICGCGASRSLGGHGQHGQALSPNPGGTSRPGAARKLPDPPGVKTHSESKGDDMGTERTAHRRGQTSRCFPDVATHQLSKQSDSFKDQSGNTSPGRHPLASPDLQLPHPYPCVRPCNGIGA